MPPRRHLVALALASLVACDQRGISKTGSASAPVTPLPEAPRESSSAPASASAAPPEGATVPTTKSTPPAPPRALACAKNFGCAIRADGKVSCWGRNDFGQLGTGTTANRIVKAGPSVAGLAPARSLALGYGHACALLDAGELWCWGENDDGQVGNGLALPDGGSLGPALKPVRVAGLASPVVQVDAGISHTCAALASGEVACWGTNYNGQLGAPGPSSSTPRIVPGVRDAVEVACGAEISCARSSDGKVSCWGSFAGGGDVKGATPIAGLCAKQITAGSSFLCALDCNDAPQCWGGAPGGYAPPPAGPTVVNGKPVDIVEIRAGYWHVCMRDKAGEISCWGSNDSGQLAQGKKTRWDDFESDPKPIRGKLWKTADALCAGGMNVRNDGHYMAAASYLSAGKTCARAETGAVYCWGEPELDAIPRLALKP